MNKIIFEDEKEKIHLIATRCFDYITSLPEGVRPKDKIRTGIQIYLEEMDTDNILLFSVYQPSERAKVFAIKKVLCMELLGDASSQNSENPEKRFFRGGLRYVVNGFRVRIGISGLFGDEDVATALTILAYLFKTSPGSIHGHIMSCNGKMPDGLFEDHYLSSMFTLKKFRELTSFE